jgi:uncharacterized protein YebE (UPF0316 family)
MLGWGLGFGAGTFVGITLEKWIATGHIVIRVIGSDHAEQLRVALMKEDVGVTGLHGEGRDGRNLILFIVAPRRRGDHLLSVIQRIDPEAFITVDPISHAIGGYMPLHAEPSSMRK